MLLLKSRLGLVFKIVILKPIAFLQVLHVPIGEADKLNAHFSSVEPLEPLILLEVGGWRRPEVGNVSVP